MFWVIWEFLESFVGGRKYGVVGLGAVQKIDNLGEVIDEFCELGCVFAAADQLVDSQVRLAMTMVWWTMMRRTVMWRTMVRRLVVMAVVEDIDVFDCSES